MNEYKVRTFLLALLVDIVVRESSPIRNLKDWEASDVRYVPFDVYSSTYRTVSLATILESDLSIITRYYTISKTETFSLAVRCVVRCGTEFVRVAKVRRFVSRQQALSDVTMSASVNTTMLTNHTAAIHPIPPTEVALRSFELGSIPASIMLFGSLFTIFAPQPPPKAIAHAMQHLAAGIMICAIAMELVPPMRRAKDLSNVLALVLGFSLGVLVMVALSIFLHECESESEKECEGDPDDVEAAESEALLNGELDDTADDRSRSLLRSEERPLQTRAKSVASTKSSSSSAASSSVRSFLRSKVGQAYTHMSEESGDNINKMEIMRGVKAPSHSRPDARWSGCLPDTNGFPWLFTL